MIPVGDYKLDPPDYQEVEEPTDLLSCPFCGISPLILWDDNRWNVACGNEGCWMYQVEWIDIDNWNTRKENK